MSKVKKTQPKKESEQQPEEKVKIERKEDPTPKDKPNTGQLSKGAMGKRFPTGRERV